LRFCRPHTNTQTIAIGIFRTSDQLVAEATTHTTEMNTRDEKSISSVGFETTIPVIKQLQTARPLRAAVK
jgi:hypothetical protein